MKKKMKVKAKVTKVRESSLGREYMMYETPHGDDKETEIENLRTTIHLKLKGSAKEYKLRYLEMLRTDFWSRWGHDKDDQYMALKTMLRKGTIIELDLDLNECSFNRSTEVLRLRGVDGLTVWGTSEASVSLGNVFVRRLNSKKNRQG